jgi:hypothetical protein
MSDILEIEHLADASITPDGKFKFKIIGVDGRRVTMTIPIENVSMLAQYLILGAAKGCEMLGLEAPEKDKAEVPIEAIPLRGMGISQHPNDQNGCHLVLRLPGFWMSLEVESTQMADFAAQMSSIARLLGPQGRA